MERLTLDPRGHPDTAPLHDAPASYGALFDEAIVRYQVLADHPYLWVSRIMDQ